MTFPNRPNYTPGEMRRERKDQVHITSNNADMTPSQEPLLPPLSSFPLHQFLSMHDEEEEEDDDATTSCEDFFADDCAMTEVFKTEPIEVNMEIYNQQRQENQHYNQTREQQPQDDDSHLSMHIVDPAQDFVSELQQEQLKGDLLDALAQLTKETHKQDTNRASSKSPSVLRQEMEHTWRQLATDNLFEKEQIRLRVLSFGTTDTSALSSHNNDSNDHHHQQDRLNHTETFQTQSRNLAQLVNRLSTDHEMQTRGDTDTTMNTTTTSGNSLPSNPDTMPSFCSLLTCTNGTGSISTVDNGKGLDSHRKLCLNALEKVTTSEKKACEQSHFATRIMEEDDSMDKHYHTAMKYVHDLTRCKLIQSYSSCRLQMATATQDHSDNSTGNSTTTDPVKLMLETASQPKKRTNLSKMAKNLLRSWFEDHIHHPYPTEEEKDLLAMQGGITIEQVNNWFINTRGRKWKPMLNRLMAQKEAGDSKLYDAMVEKIEEPYRRRTPSAI